MEKKENERKKKSFGLSKDVVPPLGEGPSDFLGLAKVDFNLFFISMLLQAGCW